MTATLARKDAVDHLRDQAAEVDRLKAILGVHTLRMLRAVHLLVAAAFPELDDFRLDDSTARRFLLQAGARAVVIDSTTQQAIAQQLAAGQALGESNLQLADRIRHLFTVTWKSRAETVARTELQESQRRAAVDRYQATGLVHQVEARDGGTNDSDSFCEGRNGRRYPLNSPPELAHPNCTLGLIPVVAG